MSAYEAELCPYWSGQACACDVRAQAVGDEQWMARRRAEEERKLADRRAARGALVSLDTDPDSVTLTYNLEADP